MQILSIRRTLSFGIFTKKEDIFAWIDLSIDNTIILYLLLWKCCVASNRAIKHVCPELGVTPNYLISTPFVRLTNYCFLTVVTPSSLIIFCTSCPICTRSYRIAGRCSRNSYFLAPCMCLITSTAAQHGLLHVFQLCVCKVSTTTLLSTLAIIDGCTLCVMCMYV